jgi:hypothetical protein
MIPKLVKILKQAKQEIGTASFFLVWSSIEGQQRCDAHSLCSSRRVTNR